MNILMVAIILVVWQIWAYVNRKMLNDFLSPFNLIFYFWILPLLVSFLNWSTLQTGISLEAGAVIFICTTILVFISLIPMYILRGKNLVEDLPRINGLTNDRVVKSEIILFFMVSLAAMYFAEFTDGLPILSYLAKEAKDSALHLVGKDSKLQVIAQGLMVAGALSFYTGMNTRSKSGRFFYFALAILVPILGVLKGSKSDIFTPSLYYAAIFYYLRVSRGERLISTSTLFIAICIFVLISYMTILRVLGLGIETGYSRQIELIYADTLIYPLNEILASVYGYMALGFQNFSNYMEHDEGTLRIGTSLFRPFLSIFMQGALVREMEVSNDVLTLGGGLNVGTYLRDLYIEGGALNCIFGSFIYAAFFNWLYVKFRRSGGGVWFFVYMIMLFPWVWIFFQNAFSILTFYVNSFYICAVFWAAQAIKAVIKKNRLHLSINS